jgi:hypothetical protein
MESESSLPRSQEPATGPCPEPDESIPDSVWPGTEFIWEQDTENIWT